MKENQQPMPIIRYEWRAGLQQKVTKLCEQKKIQVSLSLRLFTYRWNYSEEFAGFPEARTSWPNRVIALITNAEK